MEDFDNFHFKIKILYGRKNSNFACAEMTQIANSLLLIYAQTPILYKWIFALCADNPRKQAFQCTYKQKFHYRIFCALRRNSKFGSIHTSHFWERLCEIIFVMGQWFRISCCLKICYILVLVACYTVHQSISFEEHFL